METHYYIAIVKTGDRGRAGTDANVRLTLYGDSGRLEETPGKGVIIDNPGDDRERGDTDVYILSNEDGPLGKICAIKLDHDNTGGGAGWYVDSVTVDHFGTSMPNTVDKLKAMAAPKHDFTFPVNGWLATDEGTGKTNVTIGNVPSLSVIQPASKYEGTPVGVASVSLYTQDTPGHFTASVSSTSTLTITDSTSKKKTDSSSNGVEAETGYSAAGFSAKLKVTHTTAQELIDAATSQYQSADSSESAYKSDKDFAPKDKNTVIGVIVEVYELITQGQLGIVDRRFDFSHASTRYNVPKDTSFDISTPEGRDGLAKFKEKYKKYLAM